jgi:hypothetical protein
MKQHLQLRSRGMALAVLVIGYMAVIVLLIVTSAFFGNTTDSTSSIQSVPYTILSSIGGFLLIADLVGVFVFDFQGFITLNGLIKWQQIHGKSRIWLIVAFIVFFEIMLGIYLVRAAYNYRQVSVHQQQQLREQLPHQISSLEAQLGIMPTTQGECRICQKPLVISAEFCQYCGTTVIERPKVCPKCATKALPDAHWCPKCRTALA